MTKSSDEPVRSSMFVGPSQSQALLEWVLLPWRAYLVVPILVSVATVLITFAIPNQYRAVAQVYAEQRAPATGNLGTITSLASQLGVGPPASGAQSPQFYLQVLGSQRLLEDVLKGLVARGRGDSTSLLDYLDGSRTPGLERLDRTMRRLRAATEARVNPRTNIIEVSVTLKDADVAARTVALYLDALNRFNLEIRQSQAGERRRFTEARLLETQDSLLRAERAVRDFLSRNRQYRDSPTLGFEHDRLQRQVTSYQVLYTGLRRDYDTARLDEVNDTPVLTLVDPPRTPVRKASPRRALAGLGAAFLGSLLVLLWAAVRAFLGRMKRERPAQFDTIARLASRLRLGGAV